MMLQVMVVQCQLLGEIMDKLSKGEIVAGGKTFVVQFQNEANRKAAEQCAELESEKYDQPKYICTAETCIIE